MLSPSRRAFLGASLASFTAGRALAVDPPPLPLPKGDEPAFQPTTLLLTWHRDPTTTMTVQWVGTVGETPDTKVYYRPAAPALSAPLAAGTGVPPALATPLWAAQPTTARPYPLSDFKLFRAELTGLTPGTDYAFRIGKESAIYRFRTMPAKATDTIHFISGGDCGANTHAVANNVQAARQDPMFAIVGGDLAYENGKSVGTHLAFLRNYSKHMVGRNGRLIPMVACIGNHEVDGGYAKGREKAPFFYSLFDGLFPETGYATLDFGDYLSLVLLDTGHTSAIGGDQADWLDGTLRARRDHPHVFVVNHVPAYPSARKAEGEGGKAGTGELNRRHWVPLFERYRVPVVLEHHDHTFKRTKPLLGGHADADGVLYLGDGSWGRLRAPQPPEKLSVMAAINQDYHLSLHRIQGEERFHLALGEEGRVMDVARTGQRKAGSARAAG
ncbi:MAG TPA: metallophosphoesterase family protein [Gemmataceae bacterium]|nr:metallophosphoesterase family protein [Gemmataceae bacterium]